MRFLLYLPILVLLCTNFQNGAGARILAFIPSASYSHQMFYQQFWRELALRGHDMVVVTTDPTNETLPNFKEVSIRDSYPPFKKMINLMMNRNAFEVFFGNAMKEVYEEFLRVQMGIPGLKELINNKTEHFDLVMVEHNKAPHLALKHRFKCPMIGVLSYEGFRDSHNAMGNPTHPVLYPNLFLPMQGELTFVQRLTTTGFHFMEWVMSCLVEYYIDEQGRRYFGIEESVSGTMEDQTEMLFINANPLFGPRRPLTPGTIDLAGGIHLKPPKPLPKDLKTFLDTAPKGVIYLSFGSNVKSNELSLQKRDIIIKTLKSLPYKVLWKFEDDSLQGKPGNVMITKWAPQQDVLRHPNVKLFITQGGIQSLEEALYSHVPMVVVPFIADQQSNAKRVEAREIGLTLSPEDLTVDSFKDVILKVLETPKYRDNVRQLAGQIQDQPMSPLETAVWWTEYVLRHKGAQHLKGPKIPTYQYYYLDVLGVLGLVFGIFMGISIFVLKLIIKKIRSLICSTPKSIPKKSKVKRA